MNENLEKLLGLNIVDIGLDLLKENIDDGKLKKQPDGESYRGICPLHADSHNRSFYLKRRLNLFICYGCGEYGGPLLFSLKLLNEAEWKKYVCKKANLPTDSLDDEGFKEFVLESERANSQTNY